MINFLNTDQSVGKIPVANRYSVTKTRSTALEHLQSSGRNALELEAISRHFGALVALADINMTVKAGERRAVLGSNGAGKTTLFNTVTGDIPPDNRPRATIRRRRGGHAELRACPPRTQKDIPDFAVVRRSYRYR